MRKHAHACTLRCWCQLITLRCCCIAALKPMLLVPRCHCMLHWLLHRCCFSRCLLHCCHWRLLLYCYSRCIAALLRRSRCAAIWRPHAAAAIGTRRRRRRRYVHPLLVSLPLLLLHCPLVDNWEHFQQFVLQPLLLRALSLLLPPRSIRRPPLAPLPCCCRAALSRLLFCCCCYIICCSMCWLCLWYTA